MAPTLASIPENVSKKYHEFKFRRSKGSCAMISGVHFNILAVIDKINSKTGTVEIEQEIENLNLDDLAEVLCSSEPRYVLVSYEYHHDDGRLSFPYCLVFSSPRSSPNELKMLYAGSLHHFTGVSQVTKVYELQDLEDLNEEWLINEMKKKGI